MNMLGDRYVSRIIKNLPIQLFDAVSLYPVGQSHL